MWHIEPYKRKSYCWLLKKLTLGLRGGFGLGGILGLLAL